MRRGLALKSGDPYSAADLISAERALLDLGVFGSVTVKPDKTGSDEPASGPVVPIEVHVEPTRLRSIHLGDGGAVDA